MPKRFHKRAALHESFEPYWTAILVIVMGTFTLYGVQSITLAVQANGSDQVTSCFLENKESPYHKFQTCTNRTS